MSSFLDKDRAKEKKVETKDTNSKITDSPASEITYSKTQITQYLSEHEKIRQLFAMALMAYQQNEDKAFLQHLRDLQMALRRHLLDEELNLYIYLRQCYKQNANKRELITRLKKNSKQTGLHIFSYIKTVSDLPLKIRREEADVSKLLQIGNMLEALFYAEEQHLYPIYKKPERTTALS